MEIKMLKKLRHNFAHWLNWNYGVADAFYEEDKLMMSFLCTGCMERSGIHPIDEMVDRALGIDPLTNR